MQEDKWDRALSKDMEHKGIVHGGSVDWWGDILGVTMPERTPVNCKIVDI